MFYFIARTIFSHSRSEQFWQNTIEDITFFIPAKGLNQEWSCFNIGNKLFADFFQKNISMAMPVKFLSLQSVGKVTNYLTSFSSAQSEDQQCRNVRMKQKLFWSCFIWISLLKVAFKCQEKIGAIHFLKICCLIAWRDASAAQTQSNWFEFRSNVPVD